MGLGSDMVPDLGRRSLVHLVVSSVDMDGQEWGDEPLLRFVAQLVPEVRRHDSVPILVEVRLVERTELCETDQVVVDAVHAQDQKSGS